MEEPANMQELVSDFAAITDASPIIAEHYLSACNFDLNRAVEFYFEHPPAANQAGPGGNRGVRDEDDDAAAMGAYHDDMGLAGRGAAATAAAAPGDEDEELQRALAESMADAEPGSRAGSRQADVQAGGQGVRRPAGRQPQPAVEMLDVDDEELPDAEGLLAAMARQREASLEADREARARMEEAMDRMLGALPGAGRHSHGGPTVNPPPNYPAGAPPLPAPFGGLPSVFPGMPPPGRFPPGMLGRGPLFGGVALTGVNRPSGRGRDEGGGGGGSTGGAGQAQQRRRVEVQRTGDVGESAGRREGDWDEGLELPEGMSRHELEEARMMEAALLGVPYEGRLPDFSAGPRGGFGAAADADVAPEVLEHRELRWDQDRAYEESLAADRAKEQAAARAKAEAEARERAQREAEEAAARAAAAEAARLAALLSSKAARLPQEPASSAADAVTVMVRLPDGSRHSRRFARTDRLSSLFDFVDVELDTAAKAAAASPASAADAAAAGAAAAGAGTGPGSSSAAGGVDGVAAGLKPGTYNLVAQFPRRVFSEADSGSQTFEQAGLVGGGGAAFFVEQRAG